MKQYTDLVKEILNHGIKRTDRTGTGTLSLFGRSLRFNLQEGFPLITTKKVPFRLPAEEMLWFLQGDCNNKDLQAKNITIWDEWADPETGDLGPVYGAQWRAWQTVEEKEVYGNKLLDVGDPIDQIQRAVNLIKTDPTSRRILVSAWNVADLDQMALPPCHWAHQIYCDPERKRLSLMLHLRSSDVGLGLPFNMAQYALLTHMYAHVTGYTAHELVITLGDCHIYNNHVEPLTRQLEREPRPLPKLEIVNKLVNDMLSFNILDFKLLDYDPHPHIHMAVSV